MLGLANLTMSNHKTRKGHWEDSAMLRVHTILGVLLLYLPLLLAQLSGPQVGRPLRLDVPSLVDVAGNGRGRWHGNGRGSREMRILWTRHMLLGGSRPRVRLSVGKRHRRIRVRVILLVVLVLERFVVVLG